MALPAKLDRSQLRKIVLSVLPAEGQEYFQLVEASRFGAHAGRDQRFFEPSSLVALLGRAALTHDGRLDGDDRNLMMAEGLTEQFFELPSGRYSYLKVPADGMTGLLPLSELPHWVPVTLLQEQEPTTRIGFRRGAPRDTDPYLVFSVDPDFQRQTNYATVIIAPNWFGDNKKDEHGNVKKNPVKATTKHAVLDAFLGPPVPAALQAVRAADPQAKKLGWEPGLELTSEALRKQTRGQHIWVSCRQRNLPGT